MGLALSGLASGFDWKSIVDQLIEVSRTPQNRMRQEKVQLSQTTNALNDIKGLLSSLKSSATSLSSGESLLKKAATFSDSTTNWTASAASDTPSGTYQFNFVSPATASRYQGSGGIATPITGTTLISAGGLQIGAGGSTGSLGSGNITNNATLAINRTGEVAMANAISGTGALNKLAAGTLTLSANNSYSGETVVDGGTLALNGSGAVASSSVVKVGTNAVFDISGVTTSASVFNE
jgi:autotransporter-associated beta strand protein